MGSESEVTAIEAEMRGLWYEWIGGPETSDSLVANMARAAEAHAAAAVAALTRERDTLVRDLELSFADAARLRGEVERAEKQRDHWRRENAHARETLEFERAHPLLVVPASPPPAPTETERLRDAVVERARVVRWYRGLPIGGRESSHRSARIALDAAVDALDAHRARAATAGASEEEVCEAAMKVLNEDASRPSNYFGSVRHVHALYRAGLLSAPRPAAAGEGGESHSSDAARSANKERILRTLTDHCVNPANDRLVITVLDEPGAGGACHEYAVRHHPTPDEPALPDTRITFQNGPIGEAGNGVNGLTHEVLLAIVADRLRSFQKGPYSCKANACALTHIEEAQHWLQQRTLERMRRGVEGTHTV